MSWPIPLRFAKVIHFAKIFKSLPQVMPQLRLVGTARCAVRTQQLGVLTFPGQPSVTDYDPRLHLLAAKLGLG